MLDWPFPEAALAVDTRQTVQRWWIRRSPSPTAPIPDGLVEDLQTARLALEDALHHRLRDLVVVLDEPRRMTFTKEIAALDPWHVWGETAYRRAGHAATVPRTTGEDDRDLIETLKERARRRERLERPHIPSATRRRLRDLAHGRGRLTAVLKDEHACRLLRFGAMLCDLIEIDPCDDTEPDPEQLRELLAQFGEADARRAAEVVLGNELIKPDDRGRPEEPEIKEFVRAVVHAVERCAEHRLTPTIARASRDHDETPGPDLQLVLDLLACHAPTKTAEAVAALIKET